MSGTGEALVIVLPIILVSMVLHEMMHAFTADWLGDDTARLMGRISFNPIRHIDPFFTILLPLTLVLTGSGFIFGAAKPVQVNFRRLKYDEFGGALVGVIGPLTNLLIAIIAAVIFKQYANLDYGSLFYKITGYTVLVNIGFFVFNMIPWPPLDGSRLLYAFAPRPVQEFMESIEHLGMIGLVVFILVIYQLVNNPLANVMASLVNHLAPGFLQFLGI